MTFDTYDFTKVFIGDPATGELIRPAGSVETEEEIAVADAVSATTTPVDWPGGDALWSVWGTWDGATAQLELSPSTGIWIEYIGAMFSENGGAIVSIGAVPVRVVITDAGASTSLSSNLHRVG